MKKRIVFITDCTDIAYSELRGTVLGTIENPEMVDIEPVVSVHPFSIINGNFILRLMADAYPEGTIFSVVLNPMKERPERLIGKTKKKCFYFLGANTGVFDWFLKDFGVSEIYELNDPGFFPFGGKYVHAPAVAQIANGKNLNEMGNKFNENLIKTLNVEPGTIIHIDNFGLMKLNLKLSDVGNLDEGTIVQIKIKDVALDAVFSKRMMSNDTGKWILYPGSSLNLLELGKVRANGALEINASVGDIVKVKISNE
jgi:S-adenosylmethionine hydrolase